MFSQPCGSLYAEHVKGTEMARNGAVEYRRLSQYHLIEMLRATDGVAIVVSVSGKSPSCISDSQSGSTDTGGFLLR